MKKTIDIVVGARYSSTNMAEGDCFTEKLIWGFKKAYRLCISGATSDVVLPTACRAVSKAIKNGHMNFRIAPEALNIIFGALRKVASQKDELFPIDADVRESMHRTLEALLLQGKVGEIDRLCIAVAGEVFENFIGEESCDWEAIADDFNGRVADAVLERNLFAVAAENSTVRIRTCIKTKRNKHEQEQFEQEIKHGFAGWLRSYLQHLEKHEQPLRRMPSLPKVKRPFQLEEVHQGL